MGVTWISIWKTFNFCLKVPSAFTLGLWDFSLIPVRLQKCREKVAIFPQGFDQAHQQSQKYPWDEMVLLSGQSIRHPRLCAKPLPQKANKALGIQGNVTQKGCWLCSKETIHRTFEQERLTVSDRMPTKPRAIIVSLLLPIHVYMLLHRHWFLLPLSESVQLTISFNFFVRLVFQQLSKWIVWTEVLMIWKSE